MKSKIETSGSFDASRATALWLGFVAANMACIGMMVMLLMW